MIGYEKDTSWSYIAFQAFKLRRINYYSKPIAYSYRVGEYKPSIPSLRIYKYHSPCRSNYLRVTKQVLMHKLPFPQIAQHIRWPQSIRADIQRVIHWIVCVEQLMVVPVCCIWILHNSIPHSCQVQ